MDARRTSGVSSAAAMEDQDSRVRLGSKHNSTVGELIKKPDPKSDVKPKLRLIQESYFTLNGSTLELGAGVLARTEPCESGVDGGTSVSTQDSHPRVSVSRVVKLINIRLTWVGKKDSAPPSNHHVLARMMPSLSCDGNCTRCLHRSPLGANL